MIHNHWLSITHYNSQPLAQHNIHDTQPLAYHNTPRFTTSVTSLLTMSHNYWLSITHHDSQCWASGCESRGDMLSQWLWIMVSGDEQVVVNHGVFIWASGCESWWVMMNQWFWIMVGHDETVVVNRGVLCWARGCGLSITHHDSHPLAQHSSPWFTTNGSE
jgi:hypothetical protein